MRFLPGTAVRYSGPTTIERGLQVVVSAVVALFVIVGLWPSAVNYWEGLSASLGATPTLLVVAVVAVGLGAWFGRTTGFRLGELAVGTVLGYAVGMGAMTVVLGSVPTPEQLVWYGTLAGSFLAGAAIWYGLRRSRRA